MSAAPISDFRLRIIDSVSDASQFGDNQSIGDNGDNGDNQSISSVSPCANSSKSLT